MLPVQVTVASKKKGGKEVIEQPPSLEEEALKKVEASGTWSTLYLHIFTHQLAL